MMNAPANAQTVPQALDALEREGGYVEGARGQNCFTDGLDIPELKKCLGKESATSCDFDISTAVTGLAQVGEFLAGLGNDVPQAAVTTACAEQSSHEATVADGCDAADLATDVLQRIQDDCARTVEQLSSSAAGMAQFAKGILGSAQGAAVVAPVVASACAVAEKILSARNCSLEAVLESLIADHEPAAQPGKANEVLCSSAPQPECSGDKPAPTPPVVEPAPEPEKTPVAPATACSETKVPESPAEPAPAPVPSPVAEPAPAPAPAPEPAPCANTEPAKAAVTPPQTPAPSAPMTPPPAMTPGGACDVIKTGLNLAASTWQQLVGTVDGMLCPPEPPACVEAPACAEPVANPEPAPCTEPEPCAEPASTEIDPATECPDVAKPEPVDAGPAPEEPAESADKLVGFDKSQHPSVPEGAVPEQPISEAEQSVLTEIPLQTDLQPENPAPAEPVPQPEPDSGPPAPEASLDSGTDTAGESWSPDIWVAAGSDLDVKVQMSGYAEAAVIERSGQW